MQKGAKGEGVHQAEVNPAAGHFDDCIFVKTAFTEHQGNRVRLYADWPKGNVGKYSARHAKSHVLLTNDNCRATRAQSVSGSASTAVRFAL